MSGIVVQAIYCKSYAWTLVVITVLFVEGDEVFLVELVLEYTSEIDHKSILGPGLNSSSISISTITEIHSLHLGWILDELVHEPNVMESRGEYVVVYLFSDG